MIPPWRQVLIHFDAWNTAEHTAVTHLAPVLADAEDTGLIASWFFIRKAPCWRVRFLPTHDTTAHDATTVIHQRLDTLQEAGRIARWVETIYEPETDAFGGPAAMDTAHHFFHQDSRHILAYLSSDHPRAGHGDRRRELSILLCSTLLRGAKQDWYEQGDIWARVTEHRCLPPDTPQDRLHAMQSDLRRLMTVDTATSVQNGPLADLPDWSDWAAAFDHAGTELADMARNGTLRRGLRAVLAHHVIFAWNRIGLSHATQSLLATVAKAVVLDQ